MAPPIPTVVMVAAPLLLDDMSLSGSSTVEVLRLVRTFRELVQAIDEVQPTVVLIDTDLTDSRGFEAIGDLLARRPKLRVLALTPHATPHDHVARAMQAGALGFIPIDAAPEEFDAAVRQVELGDPWLPATQSRSILAAVAADLRVTRADREAQLRNFVFGLIPLTGAVAAVMSLLWRQYLAQIGVRPVDLAIDPGGRIVDALFALSVLLGVFGWWLFIGTWIDLLGRSNNRTLVWIATHPKTARIILGGAIFALGLAITGFARATVALFLGPIVGALVAMKIFHLDDDLPAALRLDRIDPGRAVGTAIATTAVFLTALTIEVQVVGPNFYARGVEGFLAPAVLGFKAQPMTVIDVGGEREPRELLYLGGNADLYVLVDPCDDDTVEYVSVGSTRLTVINEVDC